MFYGIQSEDFIRDDSPPRSIEEMAAGYIRHIRKARPNGPYHVGSWSMGVSIAYEIARQLKETGDDAGLLILLDQGPDYPGLIHRNDKEFVINLFQQKIKIEKKIFDRMSYEQVIEHVFQMAREAKLVSHESSLKEFKKNIDVLKNHTEAWIRYKPLPYSGKAVLIKSAKNKHHGVTNEDLGWSDLVTGGIDVYTIPGDHYSMMARSHAKKLAKIIISLVKGETD